jgi:hypothetical protein
MSNLRVFRGGTVLLRGGALDTRVFDVSPNPPDDKEHEKNPDHEIEAVKKRLQGIVLVPLLAELLPYVRQA